MAKARGPFDGDPFNYEPTAGKELKEDGSVLDVPLWRESVTQDLVDIVTEIDAEALAGRTNETTEHTSTRLTITTKSNEEQAKLDTIEASLASMELDLEAINTSVQAVTTEVNDEAIAIRNTIESVGEELETNNTNEHTTTRATIESVGEEIEAVIISEQTTTRATIESVGEEIELNLLAIETDVEANTTQLSTANTTLSSLLASQSGANRDAFGRWRTSGTGQRFDIEFIYDKQPDLVDEVTTNGTATFNGSTRDVTLAISATGTSDTAGLFGHPCPYTPGNSQLIDMTGVIDFANLGTGTAEVFLRSSISGTTTDLNTITQSSWTALTSGVDWADSHILSMDFQSLKVGTIRFFLVQNGSPVQIANINNDNLRNSGYWQNPTLPVSWRIWNDATYTYCEMAYGDADNAIGLRYKVAKTTSATMKAICATVKSEGGLNLQEMEGLPTSIDMGVTPKTVATTLIPLISIRPKELFNTYKNLSLALPKSFSVSTDNPIRLVVLHDATLTGASWADVNTTYSALEYDVTATALSGGHPVYSDYISTAKNTASSGQGTLGKVPLWHRLNGGTGILTIAAVRTTTTSASVLAGINWSELR